MAIQHSPNFDLQLKVPRTDRLMAALTALPDKVQKKIAKSATRKGATVVRKAAVANAKRIDDPRTAERIWKNVVVQEATKTGKRMGGIYMRVGVRGGAKQYSNTTENRRKGRVGKSYKTNGSSANPGGDTWYWRFIEFGREGVKAQPFMRPALENNAQKVFDTIAVEMQKGLDKLINEVRVK